MSRKKSSAPFSLFAFQDAITSVCGLVVLITLMLALNLTTDAVLNDAKADKERQNAKTLEEVKTRYDEVKKKYDAIVEGAKETNQSIETIGLTDAEIAAKLEEAQKELQQEEERAKTLQQELSVSQETLDEIAAIKKDSEELKAELEKLKKTSADPAADKGVIYGFPNDGSQSPIFTVISGTKIEATLRDSSKTFSTAAAFLSWAALRSKTREYFVFIVRPSGVANYRKIVDDYSFDHAYGIDLIGEQRVLEFLGREEEAEGDDET